MTIRSPAATVLDDALATISLEERRRLQPFAEAILLPRYTRLHSVGDIPGFAYFVTSGLVSLVTYSSAGDTLEVANVCHGGIVGLAVITQTPSAVEARVQVAGSALRIRGDALLSEFRRGGAVQRLLLRELDRAVAQSAQVAMCLRHHSVVERLCRWLLAAADCIRADTIHLTQEAIAEVLGIPRTSVSTAAATLQDHGFLRQRHGRVHILDRAGLERWACECYGERPGPTRRRSPKIGPWVASTRTRNPHH